MRKMVGSTVVFFGATVVAHLPFDAMTSEAIGRLLIFVLAIAAAYAINVRWLDPEIAFTISPKTLRHAIPGVIVGMVLINITPLGGFIAPTGWDNVALILAVGGFFIAVRTVRRILYLFALASVLARMSVDAIPPLVVAAFFAALFIHRFCSSNYDLAQSFGPLRETWSAIDQRTLGGWLMVLLLILLPLQAWARSEDDRVRELVRAEATRAHDPLAPAEPPQDNSSNIRLLYLIFGAALLYRWLDQSLRHKSADDKEILQMLSQQGFVEELPDDTPVARHFPGGPRGEILELYARLLSVNEKRLARSLAAQTPRERSDILCEAFPARDSLSRDAWNELTELFRRARYGGQEITGEEVDRFRRAYQSVTDTGYNEMR